MSSLSTIKATTQSKTLDEQHAAERQRDILVLIQQFLCSHGYIETATQLVNESRSVSTISRYECADNMDLMQIFKEYEEYYEMKFGRRPVFCRNAIRNNIQKSSGTLLPQGGEASIISTTDSRKNLRNKRRSKNSHHNFHPQQQHHQQQRSRLPQNRGEGMTLDALASNRVVLAPLSTDDSNRTKTTSTALPTINQHRLPSHREGGEGKSKDDGNHLGIDEGVSGFSLKSPTKVNAQLDEKVDAEPRQMWKPLPNFDGDLEMRSLALQIRRDIIQDAPGVGWSDIVDLNGR